MGTLIFDKYEQHKAEVNARFDKLKANEEELNRIFIDIYGLADELTPEVADKDVTVARIYDTKEDIPDAMRGNNYVLTKSDVMKSLISYAVGCMMGRYSLDVEGLAYAGGDFSEKWVVISDKCYLKEVVAHSVCQELQRLDCLAEGNGFGGDCISAGQKTSKGGDLCTVRPNAASSGFDSIEHSGGTREKFHQGVYTVSVHSERVEGRSGNATLDLCSPAVLDSIRGGSPADALLRDWQDAKLVDWQAIRHSLITNHYSPTTSNILPISDDEYFTDDIVSRFVSFLETVYGKDTLEENLKFIADALGGSGSPRDVIRGYFLTGFYADHVKTYKKRPIYWLFDSGKKNGFKCLVYMHRYQPDTLARIRTDYVHEQQSRYRTALDSLAQARDNAATNAEKVKLGKKIAGLEAQAKELLEYEEKIHHLADQMIAIDLDDGVKYNYAIFKDVLAKIK